MLQAQACMQAFLGAVMLLVHLTGRRLKSDRGALWFALGAVAGGVGLLLQAQSPALPPVVGVLLGNLLCLVQYLLITRAAAIVTQQRYLLAVTLQGVLSVLLLLMEAHYTWWVPSSSHRVLAAMLIVPCILSVAVVLLLRARDRVIRPATLTLAGVLGLLAVGMLGRAWGVAHGERLLTGASWAGTVFIACVALCFLWLDMLRLSARLESLAMSDPLTGLLNRRAMETFARRELAVSHRKGHAIAVLMIDMNHFKQVNDRYGHGVGDEALRQVADAIRNGLRTMDLAARIGGDEFLVLLPDASDTTVNSVTRRLHDAIARVEVAAGAGGPLRVSATIGYARSSEEDTTLDDLIQHSDADLYEQKREGRKAPAAAPRVEPAALR